MLKYTCHQSTELHLIHLTLDVLEGNLDRRWSLNETQFIVVADAAFPEQTLLLGEALNLRVNKGLKGFVEVGRIPILALTHDEERCLVVTNLSRCNRHTFALPKTLQVPELILAVVDTVKHLRMQGKLSDSLFTAC